MFLIPELEKFAQKKQVSWLGQKKCFSGNANKTLYAVKIAKIEWLQRKLRNFPNNKHLLKKKIICHLASIVIAINIS